MKQVFFIFPKLVSKKQVYSVAVFVSLTTLHASADCDAVAKRLQTRAKIQTSQSIEVSLCELQARYKAAAEKLKTMGVQDPRRVGNVYAPRFINAQHWLGYLEKNGDSEYAAWRVYDPSPLTWQNWSTAERYALNPKTTETLREGSIFDIKNVVSKLHKLAMSNFLPDNRCGTFRTDVAEIIPLHSINNAYTVTEIVNIAKSPYLSAEKKPLMKFRQRRCEDRPPLSVAGPIFRADSVNDYKACGDLTMASENEVIEQMDRWSSYLQKGLQDLSQNPESLDVLKFAAKVQQWFVAVHPFIDGNGRLSRLFMDVVLQEAHLPPPILDDMSLDFFVDVDTWSTLIGHGILNTVEAIEACTESPTRLGCKVVSSTPP